MRTSKRIPLELPLGFQANPPQFDLADIDFGQGFEDAHYFMPEELTHVYHTPHYGELSPAERRDYNRLSALALAEQFIFLEDYLLVPTIENLLRSRSVRISAAMELYLRQFITEEKRHSEMFWRILEAAAPERYKERRFVFARVRSRWGLRQALSRWPVRLPLWVWLSLLLEERTVFLARRFNLASNVSPLFRQVFELHMTEEQQHVELDEILIDSIYAKLPLWMRRIQGRLVHKLFNWYVSPRISPRTVLDALVDLHPRLATWRREVGEYMRGPEANLSFRRLNFTRRALPRTYRRLAVFPELRSVLTLLEPERIRLPRDAEAVYSGKPLREEN
ncbi:MAG: hypothetical protein RL011_1765 [Pseudomonadota bacterium]|jgi:hypothetical protein